MGGLSKKGGTWTVCEFKGGGLGKKEWVVFLRRSWYLNAHYIMLAKGINFPLKKIAFFRKLDWEYLAISQNFPKK